MADSFLGRWFGTRPPSSPLIDESRAELDRLAAARPAFVPLCGWLRDALPDLAPLTHAPALPSLRADQARARLEMGLPLLRGESLAVEERWLRERWLHLCKTLAARQSDGAAASLSEAVRGKRLDLQALLGMVLTGASEQLAHHVEELDLDSSLVMTVLRYTLFPLFTAAEMGLRPLYEGVAWEMGSCPVCGSWPLLGEFRGLDQTRYLRCGLCSAGWEVPRLWCPFCDNRDHEQLGFLHSEGEEAKYKAATCDACRGYVKMVSSLSALPPLPLLVADLATLHLDLAAAERGYTNHF